MSELRNLPVELPQQLSSLISVQPGRVVSMSLSRSSAFQMTLFAFSEGENISEESYFGDTFYYVLEGEMPLQQEGTCHLLKAGECIRIPAGTAHGIGGASAFKLLQMTVNP